MNEVKCKECFGDGWNFLPGEPAHPNNRYKCEKCKGTGKVKEKNKND